MSRFCDNILPMRRYLFLCLALVCFVGLVAIFMVDGYLGIYDTLYVTAEEYEQKIEPEFWLREHWVWSTGVSWDEKVFFRYEVDNRQFSPYSTTIKTTVWKENAKITELLAEDKVVKSFDKMTVEWTLDPKELESRGFSEGQYTIKIERNGVERKIIVDYHSRYPARAAIIR